MCNKKRFEQCAGQKDTSKGQHFSSSYGRGFAFATWCFFSHLTVFFFIPEHPVCVIVADRGLTERQAFGPSEKSPPQGSPVLCSRER